MSRSPDKLSYALCATATTTRQHYKRVFDQLYATDAAAAGFQLDDVEQHRRETVRNLEALGLCDFQYHPKDIIEPLPPYLAVAPRAGLPSVIVTGARTPALIAKLRAAARSDRALAVVVRPQPAFPLLPRRYEIQGADRDALRRFAARVDLPLVETPVPGLLLGYALGIEGYVDGLKWQDLSPDVSWRRDDFDTTQVRFTQAPVTAATRLSQYSHPHLLHRREHFLLIEGRSALVDRDWGRYAALARSKTNVLRYDEAQNALFIPGGAPLPRIFARALTACTGFAPQQLRHPLIGWARVFVGVPVEHAQALAYKLAQEIIRITFPNPLRGADD
jgi:hypothetical protein